MLLEFRGDFYSGEATVTLLFGLDVAVHKALLVHLGNVFNYLAQQHTRGAER